MQIKSIVVAIAMLFMAIFTQAHAEAPRYIAEVVECNEVEGETDVIRTDIKEGTSAHICFKVLNNKPVAQASGYTPTITSVDRAFPDPDNPPPADLHRDILRLIQSRVPVNAKPYTGHETVQHGMELPKRIDTGFCRVTANCTDHRNDNDKKGYYIPGINEHEGRKFRVWFHDEVRNLYAVADDEPKRRYYRWFQFIFDPLSPDIIRRDESRVPTNAKPYTGQEITFGTPLPKSIDTGFCDFQADCGDHRKDERGYYLLGINEHTGRKFRIWYLDEVGNLFAIADDKPKRRMYVRFDFQ